mgnify:CR=1 FL=1
MRSRIHKAYRAYIWLGNVRYYANKLPETTTTWHVKWRSSVEEYPDHFSWYEFNCIRLKYLDQHVRNEEVYLEREEEA